MAVTQKNRQFAINTPLGEDVLLLKSAVVTEELGRPFTIEAELLSEDDSVVFDDIVGQNVTIRISLPELGEAERHLNGYISRFVQIAPLGDFARYQATIVPWLWFLTRTSDCRIFQEKTVPDIIKEIFNELGFTDFEDRLSGSYDTWENCVQYRETAFNFVSRLMEQEGIYYFFLHENGKHTLVLADSGSAIEPIPDYAEIKYRPPTDDDGAAEAVHDWSMSRSVLPGTYVLNDFNFEKVKTSLVSSSSISRQHAGASFEIYDYPGKFDDPGKGENTASKRIEELQAQFELGRAETTARGVITGFKFNLVDYPRDDQNRGYLIISSRLVLDAGKYEAGEADDTQKFFQGEIQVVPDDVLFRTARKSPKPLIQGPQTAIVVGKSGEEIWTDKYGRVKVWFPWDRHSKTDENSSCWIRVAQSWAGKKWGAIYTPRIGQEVVVEFLEGDPDRPIITGRVYNGECLPPYDLPADATKSTLKSNSSKGGNGFNELRFEDKKGEEQIFIHGEKDLDLRVKNDRREWVGNEQHVIVTKDDYKTVEGDQHSTVAGDQKEKVDGEKAEIVGGDHLSSVAGAEHIKVSGDQNTEVGGDLNVKGKANVNQEASQKLSIKSGQDLHIKAGQNYAVDGGMGVHIKGGMAIVIEGGTQVSLKVGGSFVDVGPSGVSISGPMVNINTGGAAGSGGGSSPTAPSAPEEPEEPGETAEAADEGAGQTAAAPKAPKPPKPVTYSASAEVMKQAASDGTPLCEECEKAKKEQAAASA